MDAAQNSTTASLQVRVGPPAPGRLLGPLATGFSWSLGVVATTGAVAAIATYAGLRSKRARRP